MKIKVRSRNDRLEVCDDQGNVIRGVVAVEMMPWKPGDPKPQFRVVIEVAAAVAVDGDAEVEQRAPAAKPAESKVEIDDGKQPAAADAKNKGGAKA